MNIKRYIPWGIVDGAKYVGRTISHPWRYLNRVQAGRRLLAGHPPAVCIDREAGYWVGSVGDIPGLASLYEKLRAFTRARLPHLSPQAILEDAKQRHINLKPFYFNMLRRQDMAEFPEITGFATGTGILPVLADYYGLLPELSHAAIFLSGFLDSSPRYGDPGWTPAGSQKWHWDNGDPRHVKLFVLLDDVGAEDGPLTFLPAPASRRIRIQSGRRFMTSPFKRDEEMVPWLNSRDVIRLTGKAGTAALLDTSRCLHQGSRCRAGRRRLAFSLHYVRHAEYKKSVSKDYQDINLATAPEFRSHIEHDPTKSLVWRIVGGSK
jgi:hypothetical protein